MSGQIIFCEECRKDVGYNETDVIMSSTLKGETYEYSGRKATCADYGFEVYIAKNEDYNLKKLYDAYRVKSKLFDFL